MRTIRKRRGYRQRMLPALLAALCLFAAAGCEQETSTADLYIQIDNDKSLSEERSTAVPEDTDLEVSYYEISGSGPDGAEFQLTAEDSQATVPGLPLGDWQVDVIGFSNEDQGLSYGETVITLEKETHNGVIVTKSFYGKGSAQIIVTWDESQTIDPRVDVNVSLMGSDATPESLTPVSSAAGTATYEMVDYEAGAYLLQTELYSDGVYTDGAASLIRIVDKQMTNLELDITSDDLLVGMQLTLHDTYSRPLSGSITGIPLTAPTGERQSVSFTPDPEFSQEEFSCMWYVDGVAYTTGNPIEFTPEEGIQRLDVLVSTADIGSEAMASQLVEGLSGIEPDQPLLYRSYGLDNDENILVDGISDIVVLPDGLVVTASRIDDAVQSLSIEQDQLVLNQTIEHGGTQLLDGVSELAVSEDGTFIAAAADNSQAVTIFEHAPGSYELSHLQTILTTGTSSSGSYTIEQIGDMALSDDGQVLIISDRSGNSFEKFTNTGTMYEYTDSYTFSSFPEVSDPRSLDFGMSSEVLAAASTGSNALFLFSKFLTDSPQPGYILDWEETQTPGLSQVHSVGFITEDRLITLAQDTLSEFYFEPSPIFYSQDQISRLKESTHIPVPFRPKDFASVSTGETVYAVTSTGNGIVILKRDPISGSLEYDMFVSTDEISPDSCAASADDGYLLAGAAAQDRLMLYKLAQ